MGIDEQLAKDLSLKISLSSNNPVQVQLKNSIDIPSWMKVVFSGRHDFCWKYKEEPEQNVPLDMIIIKINDLSYEVSPEMFDFVNRRIENENG